MTVKLTNGKFRLWKHSLKQNSPYLKILTIRASLQHCLPQKKKTTQANYRLKIYSQTSNSLHP